MKLILLLSLVLSLSFANSPHESIKDELGAYYYYSEIDNIIDETYAKTMEKYTNQIQELINNIRELEAQKNIAISNLINNYENKIIILDQKHELELNAFKLKNSIKKNNMFFFGFGTGLATSIGTAILINQFDFPLFKITF